MEKVAQRAASKFVFIPEDHYADQIKENEVEGACGTHGRGVYRVSVAKPERKRPSGRPKRIWEDGTKTGLSGLD
jgi:hypothetical protein